MFPRGAAGGWAYSRGPPVARRTRVERTLIRPDEVEGLDDAQFAKAAQGAKASCPVSKALTGVDIRLDAQLEH